MDFRLIYSEKALADLDAILSEIAADDPAAASRFGTSLLDHIDLLMVFPQMGVAVPDRVRVRKLIHTPIVVYYIVNMHRRIVEIARLHHGARVDPRQL
jgi:toxin ParE1/3/4